MSNPFPSATALAEHVAATAHALAQADMPEAAAELQAVRETAYTTSSEWLGDLGSAAARILARRDVPLDLRAHVERIRKAARAAFRG